MTIGTKLKKNNDLLVLVYMLLNSDRFIDQNNRIYVHPKDKEGLKNYPRYTYCRDSIHPYLFNLKNHIKGLFEYKIIDEIICRRIHEIEIVTGEPPITETVVLHQNVKDFNLKLLEDRLYAQGIENSDFYGKNDPEQRDRYESIYLEYQYDYFLKINKSNAEKFIKDYLKALENDLFNVKTFKSQLRYLCQQIENYINFCNENNLVLSTRNILINKDENIEDIEPLIFYLEDKKCIDIKYFFENGFQAEILKELSKSYLTPLKDEIIFSLDFIDKQDLIINSKYVLSVHKTGSEVYKFLNHIFDEYDKIKSREENNSVKIELSKTNIHDKKSNILRKMQCGTNTHIRNLFFPNTRTDNVIYFRKEVRKKDLDFLKIKESEVLKELETLSKRQI